jgi:hypothetical protein
MVYSSNLSKLADIPKSLKLKCKVTYRGRTVDLRSNSPFGAMDVDWSSVTLDLYVDDQRKSVYSSVLGKKSYSDDWTSKVENCLDQFFDRRDFSKVERKIHKEFLSMYVEEREKDKYLKCKKYDLKAVSGEPGEFTYVLSVVNE